MAKASVAADWLGLGRRRCRFAAAIAGQELFADSESKSAAQSSAAEKGAQGHPFAFVHLAHHTL